ncbi:MAG: hypothetical protein ACLSUM_07420 [Dysosmobacter welbionis]
MDINQGYSILNAVMLENGRGFALGLNPKAPQPFVTWACYDDEHGIRQYEWGHYGSDRAALEQDLADRVREYREFYKVNVHHIEAPGLYKYYSTQRPVDIGTFPKPPHNAPDEIVNHDMRIPVEGRPFQAWGHLTYTRPLSNQQMRDYELRPSEDNPDLQRRMVEQAQVVGRWETAEAPGLEAGNGVQHRTHDVYANEIYKLGSVGVLHPADPRAAGTSQPGGAPPDCTADERRAGTG